MESETQTDKEGSSGRGRGSWQRLEMSRKEVNNEQVQWDREKKHKDALIRSARVPWFTQHNTHHSYERDGLGLVSALRGGKSRGWGILKTSTGPVCAAGKCIQ